jgi:hypothetical protein
MVHDKFGNPDRIFAAKELLGFDCMLLQAGF